MTNAALVNAKHVFDAIRKRHPRPEWELFAEVRDSTGTTGSGRRADAIAVSTWPSRGFAIIGFEIKVSRSDWQAELRDPQKADPLMQFCDRWFVAAPRGIVVSSEVPETWGLLELTGAGLRVKVDAPKLAPVPMTRGFVCGLLRQTGNGIAAEIHRRTQAEIAIEKAQMEENINRRANDKIKDAQRVLSKKAEIIAAVEAAFGGNIPLFADPGKLAEQMKLAEMLQIRRWGDLETQAENLGKSCAALVEQMQKVRAL